MRFASLTYVGVLPDKQIDFKSFFNLTIGYCMMTKYQPLKTDMDLKLASFIFPIQIT